VFVLAQFGENVLVCKQGDETRRPQRSVPVLTCEGVHPISP
jgi:hypothetical protein